MVCATPSSLHTETAPLERGRFGGVRGTRTGSGGPPSDLLWRSAPHRPLLGERLERGLDLGREQVQVRLGGVVRVKRMEAEALPPRTSAGVERSNDNGAAGSLRVQLDCGATT